MKMPIPEKLYKKIYKIVPRLTVDAIVKTPRGILLARREFEPHKGCWNFPGGVVYYGETLEHAVKRKVLDEVGLKVKIKKFLGVYEFPLRYTFGHVITHVFLCKPTGGKIKNAKFFKKIPRNIYPGQRTIIKRFVK